MAPRTARKRTEEETIPFTEHQGRRWFRQLDVEVLAAARSFGRARKGWERESHA